MSEKESISRKRKGDIFEQEISELYAAMGCKVRRNVPVEGQEVDILASRRMPDGVTYKVIVECKYKGGRTRAGNQDVQSIAGAFYIAKAANLVTACTVVTTNGFSLDAQQAAASAGINLTTKQELVNRLIDFSDYFRDLQQRYVEDFGDGENSC